MAVKLKIALNAKDIAKAIEYGNILRFQFNLPLITIAETTKNSIAEKLVNALKKYTPFPLFLLYIFF